MITLWNLFLNLHLCLSKIKIIFWQLGHTHVSSVFLLGLNWLIVMRLLISSCIVSFVLRILHHIWITAMEWVRVLFLNFVVLFLIWIIYIQIIFVLQCWLTFLITSIVFLIFFEEILWSRWIWMMRISRVSLHVFTLIHIMIVYLHMTIFLLLVFISPTFDHR